MIPRGEFRTIGDKAGAYIEQGDAGSPSRFCRRRNGLIDPERDPRLVLCIRHNLIDNLSKMGCHVEAADLLPELRELATAQGGTMDHLRLRWVERRVAAGLGEHERARKLLTRADLPG